MVRLLIESKVNVNAKNSAALTALDILHDRSDQEPIRQLLLRAGALKGSSLPTVPTLIESL